MRAMCLAVVGLFLLGAGGAEAQTAVPLPSAGKGTKPSVAKDDLDLPFEEPSREMANTELPPPPEEPEPVEEPPTFSGEPIPSENSTIFYVVDKSCSMGWDYRTYVDEEGNTKSGNRMDRAKVELRKSVNALPKNFKFNLLAYGCSLARWRTQMVEANVANKGSAIGWINSLYPNDGTMTGPATATALQDKDNKSVVLLTDGAPNCGASGTSGHRSLIKAANTQGAIVTVFGIGASGYLKQFCQDIANDNNGSYTDIP